MRRLKDLILREETRRGCKLGHLRREFNSSVRQGAPTSALLRLAGGASFGSKIVIKKGRDHINANDIVGAATMEQTHYVAREGGAGSVIESALGFQSQCNLHVTQTRSLLIARGFQNQDPIEDDFYLRTPNIVFRLNEDDSPVYDALGQRVPVMETNAQNWLNERLKLLPQSVFTLSASQISGQNTEQYGGDVLAYVMMQHPNFVSALWTSGGHYYVMRKFLNFFFFGDSTKGHNFKYGVDIDRAWEKLRDLTGGSSRRIFTEFLFLFDTTKHIRDTPYLLYQWQQQGLTCGIAGVNMAMGTPPYFMWNNKPEHFTFYTMKTDGTLRRVQEISDPDSGGSLKPSLGATRRHPSSQKFRSFGLPSYIEWHFSTMNLLTTCTDKRKFSIKDIIGMTPSERSGPTGFSGFLENCHQWVQYAFPTITQSQHFKAAPKIEPHEFKVLKELFEDEKSDTYQLYRIYVDEFLQLKKERGRTNIAKWKTQKTNHNLKRISRMFECFRVLHLPKLSAELFELVGDYTYSVGKGRTKSWSSEVLQAQREHDIRHSSRTPAQKTKLASMETAAARIATKPTPAAVTSERQRVAQPQDNDLSKFDKFTNIFAVFEIKTFDEFLQRLELKTEKQKFGERFAKANEIARKIDDFDKHLNQIISSEFARGGKNVLINIWNRIIEIIKEKMKNKKKR